MCIIGGLTLALCLEIRETRGGIGRAVLGQKVGAGCMVKVGGGYCYGFRG